jgi:WD40 repeat protein/tetratricopeptide (TPR) repeat protein
MSTPSTSENVPAGTAGADPAAPAKRFCSLAEMRSAHNALLKLYREVRNSLRSLEDIRRFLERGRATGALLGSDSERSAAQSLLDYWATTLYRVTGQEVAGSTLADFELELEPELPEERCPYPGLAPLQEGQKEYFFGRQQFVRECLDRLKRGRLLALLSWPGSGATSLVQAGVVPALKGDALPGSETWRYYPPITPGADPLAALARLLLPGSDQDAWLRQQSLSFRAEPERVRGFLARHGAGLSGEEFQRDRTYLARLLAELGDEPAVLVVDQFDEVFTLCGERQRQAFADNLAGLLEAQPSHHVVLVMRRDYARRMEELPLLREPFQQGELLLPHFTTTELREAIEEPAKLVGLKFDDGLVEQLLLDVQGDPLALPLLQFTLQKLWAKRARNRLTWEAYRQVGGGRRALQLSAEAFSRELTPQEQETARRVLLQLVQPTLGPEVTLRYVPRALLEAADESAGHGAAVVAKLLRARLVYENEGGLALASEALVNHWPELRQWLDDARFELRRRLRLSESARQWREHGKDPAGLRRGSLLQESLVYHDLNELEREFVAASVAAERAEAMRERRRYFARLVALGSIALLVVALLAIWLTLTERARNQEVSLNSDLQKAKSNLEKTRLRLLEANGRKLLEEGDLAGALLWFAQAQSVDNHPGRRHLHALRLASGFRQLPRLSQLWPADRQPNYAEFDQDGKRVVIALGKPDRPEGEAQVRKASTGKVIRRFPHPGEIVDFAWFNKAGSLVVTASRVPGKEGGIARVWDSKGPVPKKGVPKPILELPHEGTINWASFSPDGRFLVTASGNSGKPKGEAQVWDLQQRSQVYRLPHGGAVNSAFFSPDSRYVVTASGPERGGGGRVQVWDLRDPTAAGTLAGTFFALAGAREPALLLGCSAFLGKHVLPPPVVLDVEHKAMANWAAFSPDQNLVVTASGSQLAESGEVQVWDWRSRSRRLWLQPRGGVPQATFSPDSQRIVTASHDGTARLWDARSGKQLFVLRHGRSVWRAEFSPDGRFVVSASRDRTARVWETATGDPVLPPLNHAGTVSYASFSGDGRQVVTTSQEAVRVWEVASSNPPPEILKTGGPVQRVVFGPVGRLVITHGAPPASGQGKARLWDLVTGRGLLPGCASGLACAAFNHDRSLVVAASNLPASVTIWDVKTGKARTSLEGACAERVNYVSFSPNGKYVVTATGEVNANTGAAQVWDARTGKKVGKPLQHEGAILWAAFSPDEDNRCVVTASADDQARVWHTQTGREISNPLQHTADVLFAGFSPDGELVITASADGTARLWDAWTGELHRELKHGSSVNHAGFSPDGRYVVTGSHDGLARVWNVKTAELVALFRLGGNVQRVWWEKGQVVTVCDHSAGAVPASSSQPPPGLGGPPSLPPGSLPPRASRATASEAPQRWVQLRRWNVSPDRRPSGEMRRRIELLAGRRYDPQHDAVISLEPKAWLAPREGATAKGPDLPARGAKPHERETAESEATGQWWSAIWHLTRLLNKDHANATLYARRAQARVQLRQWDRAVGDYSAALKLQPRTAAFLGGRARAQAARRRWEEAVQDYSQAIALQEDRQERRRLYEARGEAHEAKWEWDRAIEDYTAALDTRDGAAAREDGRLLQRRARARAQRERWGEAVQDYTEAIRLKPDPRELGQLYWARASALVKMAKPEWARAIADYTEALKFAPNNWFLLAERAEAAAAAGRRAEAAAAAGRRAEAVADYKKAADAYAGQSPGARANTEGYYTAALELDEKDWSLWQGRARARAAGGQWQEAISDYQRALSLRSGNPHRWQIHQERAELYLRLRAWDRAIEDYTQALALNPRDWRLWQGRARAFVGQASLPPVLRFRAQLGAMLASGSGNALDSLPLWCLPPAEPRQRALEDYSRALALQPQNWQLRQGRAEAFARLGRWQEALEDYDEALEFGTASSVLWKGRGKAHAELGHWKEAAADFARATALARFDSVAWSGLALVQLAQGKEKEHRKTCARLLELFGKTTVPALANDVAWTGALAPGAVTDPGQLVLLADSAVRATPGNPFYRNTLGAALYRQGDWQHAIEQLDRKKGDDSAWDWLFLALAHQRAGRPKEARRWLDKAVRWIEENARARRRKGTPPLTWSQRLELDLLRREAEALLKSGTNPGGS